MVKEEHHEQFILLKNIRIRDNVRIGDLPGIPELMNSIKNNGTFLEPIKVWEEPKSSGRYQVAWGARRFEAARQLGWERLTIPEQVMVLTEKPSEDDLLIKRVEENEVREDLNPGEVGRAYLVLHEKHGMSIDAIAIRFNRTRANIQRHMTIASKYTREDQAMIAQPQWGNVKKKGVPTQTAETIANKFGDESDRSLMLHHAFREGIDMDELEMIIYLMRSPDHADGGGGLSMEDALVVYKRVRFINVRVAIFVDVASQVEKEERFRDARTKSLPSINKILAHFLRTLGGFKLPENLFFIGKRDLDMLRTEAALKNLEAKKQVVKEALAVQKNEGKELFE